MKRLLWLAALLLPFAAAAQDNSAIPLSNYAIRLDGGNPLPVGYLTIQDEGVNLPQESVINCVGANITCTDDAANFRTLLTISGGGGGLADPGGNGLVNRTALNTTAPYAGATCTNQAVSALSAAGAATCSTITGSFVASATIALANMANAAASSRVLGSGSAGSGASYVELTTSTHSFGASSFDVALTQANDGGAVVAQASSPGTQQGSSGSKNFNVNGKGIVELDAVAATPTDNLTLQNTTAAANGAQQYSPAFKLCGTAWNSGGSASETDCARFYLLTIQQAGATTFRYSLDASIAGGAFANKWYVDSNGTSVQTGGATFAGNITDSGSNALASLTSQAGGTGGFQLGPGSGGFGVYTSQSQLLTLATGATTTDTTGTMLPAGAVIYAVVGRITTTITTAANFQIGDSSVAARFCSSNSTLTSGTTFVCLNQVNCGNTTCTATNGMAQASAGNIRVTTNVNPGAGAIRLQVFYLLLTPPTS